MRHLKNIIIIISMIFMVVIINGFNKKSDSKNLKVDSSINTNKIVIACGTDASGMLMSYILKNKITNIELSNFDYTELMDCCGAQAEFAFMSGKVDMAVLCPDASAKFLGVDTNYFIVDSIVRGSNILVYFDEAYENIEPKNIGYMNKRLLQETILKDAYPNASYYPMLSTALPYALAKKEVDAIFTDIILALKIKNAKFKAINTDKVDYYLVASKKLKGSDTLNNFIKAYNNAVNDIQNDNILSDVIGSYLGISDSKGETDIWKKMNVQFNKIETEL